MIIVAVAPYFSSRFFQKPELALYLRLAVVGVFGIILLNFSDCILSSLQQFRKASLFKVLRPLTYTLTIGGLLSFGALKIGALAIAYVSIPVVIGGFALSTSSGRLFKSYRNVDLEIARDVFVPSFWIFVYTAVQWIIANLHVVMLARYFSLAEVGLYGFGLKIFNISLIAMNSVKTVVLPKFLCERNKELVGRSFRTITWTMFFLSIPLLMAVPFTRLFVEHFAGSKYVNSVPVIQVFLVGTFLSTVFAASAQALFALDKLRLIAFVGLGAVLVNVIGHVTITRLYGGVGCSIIQVLSFGILNATLHVFAMYHCRKEHGKA